MATADAPSPDIQSLVDAINRLIVAQEPRRPPIDWRQVWRRVRLVVLALSWVLAFGAGYAVHGCIPQPPTPQPNPAPNPAPHVPTPKPEPAPGPVSHFQEIGHQYRGQLASTYADCWESFAGSIA